MNKNLFFIYLIISSFTFGQETLIRNDAGLKGNEGAKSGFFETLSPINYPQGASSWWHLLDVRHTNPNNNYAMQFAGSFFDQELWFRKTNDNAQQPWRKIIIQNTDGLVEIKNKATKGHLLLSTFDEENSDLSRIDIDFKIDNRNQIISRISSKYYDSSQGGTGGLFFYTSNAGDLSPKFIIQNSGNASLQGKLEAKEIKVTTTPTADFVFADNYHLPTLEDVEKHIKEKRHLPEIASAKEMEKEGVNIGEFQIKLLQKIEELTLYSIEQNKKIKELEDKMEKLVNK